MTNPLTPHRLEVINSLVDQLEDTLLQVVGTAVDQEGLTRFRSAAKIYLQAPSGLRQTALGALKTVVRDIRRTK